MWLIFPKPPYQRVSVSLKAAVAGLTQTQKMKRLLLTGVLRFEKGPRDPTQPLQAPWHAPKKACCKTMRAQTLLAEAPPLATPCSRNTLPLRLIQLVLNLWRLPQLPVAAMHRMAVTLRI